MSAPGPVQWGPRRSPGRQSLHRRRSECPVAVGAKHLCGRHWRPCLLTKVAGTCPRNAMRPNRLQCGDIAAHTALLVIGPDMCWRGGRIRCWKLTSPRRPNRWPYIAMNSGASYTTTMRSSIFFYNDITELDEEQRDEITFEFWLEEMISLTESDDTSTG